MIPTGIFPSIYKVHVGTTTIDGAGHNVFRLSSAYILIALAITYRRKAFLHKRLMLGGMVMLMSAAIFRISFDLKLEASQLFNKGLQVLPAVLLFLFDLAQKDRFYWPYIGSFGIWHLSLCRLFLAIRFGRSIYELLDLHICNSIHIIDRQDYH